MNDKNKTSTPGKLYIKNMVCNRCIMSVENILRDLNVGFSKVALGEVETSITPAGDTLEKLSQTLSKVGFELIETKSKRTIEAIKKWILYYIDLEPGEKKVKLSAYITSHIHNDYSYLSDIFSSVEGITIEQYLIVQRIEKVKELLVYEETSLTEIAWQLGFSSVHHLSAQFKKVTGLTPSHFKKIGAGKRRSLDKR